MSSSNGMAGVADRVVRAWAEQSADAFAEVFTEDGTMVLPASGYRSGREEIREFMAAAFLGPFRHSRVTGKPLGLRMITPDVGVMVTAGGVMLAGETEVPPEREIRATWVVVRNGGGWQLAAYHNCPVH